MEKPPKLNRTTSKPVFWCQFETIAEHNYCTCLKKSTYLITTLQGQATDVLHGIQKAATYEETLEALEDQFGDQHIATMYRSQLNTRTQTVGESLQEFATAIKQLIHHGYQALPEDHIRRAAGKAFADGVEDPAIIIQLLLEEEMVNETLRQALKLQAVLLATRPHKTSTRTFWGNRMPSTRRRDTR
jgi:hypothetical protein